MIEVIQEILGGDSTALAELSPFVIAALIFAITFVSEDAACLAAGTLAGQGRIALATALLACFTGIVAGDLALYWVGRISGASLFRNRSVNRFIAQGSVHRAGKWLEREGAKAVFVSRFVTGLRLPTYLAAGFMRTSFRSFFAYFLLAAAIWTPIAVGVSYLSSGLFAQQIFLAIVLGFLAIRLGLKLLTHENRRLLLGRVKRVVEWEFWPVQVFYLPVVIYFMILAIRFRGVTVFTAANPSIMGGGFVGESKDAIYELMARSTAARASMLKHLRIEAPFAVEERIEKVMQFVQDQQLPFPIVLKPDVGERGKGVTIARTIVDVESYLAAAGTDTIAQEFVDGVEASVYYYRFPDEGKGRIFSITEKIFPTVTGDGVSDLRRLILSDDRAVALANKYFRHNVKKLHHVPSRGELVQLIDIGTHSRGAIFVDGGRLNSENLERAIDEICRSIDGFNFGRFDLRADSFEDFQNGGPFRIIELNGVSSESTNIYDPKYSLFAAYRILFRQWRLAFEIGAANRDLGVAPTPVSTLIRLVLGLKATPECRELHPQNS